MKLPAHRAGLPGKVISFYIVPLDPAYKAGLAGHVPVKRSEFSRLSFLMKFTWLSLMVLIFLAGSCASGPKTNIKTIDWGSRIGAYTYEEALAELGEPDVISESSKGKSAEWVLRRSPGVSFGFGIGSGSYGHHTSTGVGVGTSVSPPPSGEYLRLRFDKDGKLAEWTKVKY